MFQTITPSEHKSHKEMIDSFMKEFEPYNPSIFKNFHELNEATLILANEDLENIKGGAILLKRKPSSLHPILQAYLKDIAFPNQQVWAGTIYLHFHEEIRGHAFESLCKIFYRNLYESLIAFGVKEKTSFLCLTLDPCEHLCTDLMGFWPYKVQVRPRESKDGLFHGLLYLTCEQKKKNPCFNPLCEENSDILSPSLVNTQGHLNRHVL